MKLFTVLIACFAIPLNAFALSRAQGYCQQGGQVVVTSTVPSTTRVQQSYPQCSITVFFSSPAGGTVTTNGNTVTLNSGTGFNPNGQWSGLSITINSSVYTIASVSSAYSLTLTTSAGAQAYVEYSMPATAPAPIYSNVSGTPLANPFVSTNTGYWFFHAANGTYNVQASGGGIPVPFTWGAVSLVDSQNLPSQFSDNLIPSQYSNLQALCLAAAAAGQQVTSSNANVNQPTFTCSAKIVPIGGALIQPAAGQTVTFSVFPEAGLFHWIDTATTGGSISFSAPTGPVMPEWFGAGIGSMPAVATYTAFTAAQNSLPSWIGGNSSKYHLGSIQLADTGFNGAYQLGQTFNLSPRVILAGAPSRSSILQIPLSGFSGSYMINVPNSLSTSVPNANFNTGLHDLVLDACVVSGPTCTANNLPGGVQWNVSLSSTIERVQAKVGGSGIAFNMGTTTGGIDNTSGRDNECDMYPVSGSLSSQCMNFQSSSGTTFIHKEDNLKMLNAGAYSTCGNVGSLSVGISPDALEFHGVDAENVPCPVSINQFSANVTIDGLKTYLDCVAPFAGGSGCSTPLGVYAAIVDPRAFNIKINGSNIGHWYSLILASQWQANTGVTTSCPDFTGAATNQSLYGINCVATIVDTFGCIQLATGGGVTGASLPAWGGSSPGSLGPSCSNGSTTSDGSVTWTNEGAVNLACNAYWNIVRDCYIPSLNVSSGSNGVSYQLNTGGSAGSISLSDETTYEFSYDSNVFFNPPPPVEAASLVGANFNTTADQRININWPRGKTRFYVKRVVISNASTSLTAAVGGLYTGASKSGCAIVSPGQTYNGLTSTALQVDAPIQECARGIGALGISSGTYTSGGSITGSAGQTCLLYGFNMNNYGALATVALTGTNTIAGGTVLTILNPGDGNINVSTSASLASLSATCSGVATITTTNGGGGLVLTNGAFAPIYWSLTTPQGSTATADVIIYGDFGD